MLIKTSEFSWKRKHADSDSEGLGRDPSSGSNIPPGAVDAAHVKTTPRARAPSNFSTLGIGILLEILSRVGIGSQGEGDAKPKAVVTVVG